MVKLIFTMALLAPVAASASTVTYSTTGLFLSDSNISITNGATTLTYTGTPSSSIILPTLTNLGTFTLSGSGTGTLSDSFELEVEESSPVASGMLLFGTVSYSGGTISLSFSGSSYFSNGVELTISPEMASGSTESLSASLTQTQFTGIYAPPLSPLEPALDTAPEPASLALVLTGLAGVGQMVRRRRK